MESASKHRILVVCEGNTCRSPVFASLLLREICRLGRTDIDVLSAGWDENQTIAANKPNGFAIAALSEKLDPDTDVVSREIICKAREHPSQGLSHFKGQHFDLIVLLDEARLEAWNISATQTTSRFIGDEAWKIWSKAGSPSYRAEEPNADVLIAYRTQTDLMEAYAVELARQVLPGIT